MVYVGKREYKFRGMIMSHMVADTIEELDDMALNKLGMSSLWFQDKPGKPHYDVSKANKQKAIKLGAKLVDDREIIRILTKTPPEGIGEITAWTKKVYTNFKR